MNKFLTVRSNELGAIILLANPAAIDPEVPTVPQVLWVQHIERAKMQMSTEEIADGITKVVLDGRFDIAGAEAVDLKMSVVAGSKKLVVIDMRKVAFLGSMGLRTIVSAARTIRNRGGKMAVYGPGQEVERVLSSSGLGPRVSIHQDLGSAIASLR